VPDATDRTAQLARRKGETADAHRGFLLWMMQAPARRSKRATAKAVGKSEAAARLWHRDNQWQARAEAVGLGGETLAARAYAVLYHPSKGPGEVTKILHLMTVEYVGPSGTTAPPPPKLTIPVRKREERRQATEEEAGVLRRRRLELILDAAEGRLAEQLKNDKTKVAIADLVTIVRLRRELGDGPTAAQMRDPLATSIRVEEALRSGQDPMDAMQADLDEMGLILATLRNHQQESNVLPFPGGRPDLRVLMGGTGTAGPGKQ